MRHFILLIFFTVSVPAFAAFSSVEFTVVHDGDFRNVDHFRALLDEEDPRNDTLYRQRSINGTWSLVFAGPISYIELPLKSAVENMEINGPRGRSPSIFRHSDYELKGPMSAGLRLRSDTDLVVVSDYGSAVFPWPGEIIDIRALDSKVDEDSGFSFEVMSIKGTHFVQTYLILNYDYENPYPIFKEFFDRPLKAYYFNNRIVFPDMDAAFDPEDFLRERRTMLEIEARPVAKPQAPAAKVTLKTTTTAKKPKPKPMLLLEDKRPKLFEGYKRDPSPAEVLDELVRALDTHELIYAPNAENLATVGVGEIILREFPRLSEIVAKEPAMDKALMQTARAMARLWLHGRLHNGAQIKRVVETRLEYDIENRTKCELSLASMKGKSRQADAYDRGEALRGLNVLFRRLYK